MPSSLSLFIASLSALFLATVAGELVGARGFPLPPIEKRAGCIDGLRGYLALFVFTGHSLIWINVLRGDGVWKGSDLFPFSGLGAAAVPTFFMVTGFLFYGRVVRGFKGNNWRAVFVTRAFRILPLVTLSTILISALIAIRYGVPNGYTPREFAKPFGKWILSVDEPPLFRHDDSGRINAYVFWSLRFEWLFYIAILPTLAAVMQLKPKWLPRWAIPVLMMILAIGLRMFSSNQAVAFLPLFAVGMLANEVSSRQWLSKQLTNNAVSYVVVASALASASLPRTGVPVLNMVLDGIVFVSIASGNSLWGLLTTRGALVLGECSFSIYVLHGLLIYILFSSPLATSFTSIEMASALPMMALILTPLTAISYILIERRFIAMGVNIADRITRRPANLSPVQLDVAP